VKDEDLCAPWFSLIDFFTILARARRCVKLTRDIWAGLKIRVFLINHADLLAVCRAMIHDKKHFSMRALCKQTAGDSRRSTPPLRLHHLTSANAIDDGV